MGKIILVLTLIILSGCTNVKLESGFLDNYKTISYGSVKVAYDTSDSKARKVVNVIEKIIELTR